jgi:4-diphosphocytidyl-2-C-methyl-D-erythritol kinase
MAAFFDEGLRNDCQQLVRRLYPSVDNALIVLGNVGEAKLTGSGACVFISFENVTEAQEAQEQLPEEMTSILARGVNRAPLPTELL